MTPRPLLFLLALAACTAASVRPGSTVGLMAAPAGAGPFQPRKPGKPELAVRYVAAAPAPDSIIVDGSLVMPADDGKGALDSLAISLMGITAPRIIRKPAPAPGSTVTFQFRAETAAGTGPSTSTYQIYASAFTFRGGLNSPETRSNTVTVVVPIAPLGPTSMTIQAMKKP